MGRELVQARAESSYSLFDTANIMYLREIASNKKVESGAKLNKLAQAFIDAQKKPASVNLELSKNFTEKELLSIKTAINKFEPDPILGPMHKIIDEAIGYVQDKNGQLKLLEEALKGIVNQKLDNNNKVKGLMNISSLLDDIKDNNRAEKLATIVAKASDRKSNNTVSTLFNKHMRGRKDDTEKVYKALSKLDLASTESIKKVIKELEAIKDPAPDAKPDAPRPSGLL